VKLQNKLAKLNKYAGKKYRSMQDKKILSFELETYGTVATLLLAPGFQTFVLI